MNKDIFLKPELLEKSMMEQEKSWLALHRSQGIPLVSEGKVRDTITNSNSPLPL
jgi:hypothetical protein